MKTRLLLITLSFFLMYACSEPTAEKGTGYLTLNISQSSSVKTDIEIENFTLRISNGNTDVIKERISNLPAEIPLPEGTYTIEAYSVEFFDPKFETPIYSGKTTVDIVSGETKEAMLICSQGNAGVKVVWSNVFSELYSTYYAQIYSDADRYLHYSASEARTGYFLPGTVSVSIMADGQNIFGGMITLAARDMVTASLHPKYEVDASGGLSIEIFIDETVNEREVDIIVEPNSETNPYSIAHAIIRQGENAWISGYIVGSKPSAGYDFVNGAWLATNIVLADNIAETDDRRVIFVELGSSGVYRTNLNLVNHPNNLHRKILLRGNLREYQSRSGLRDLTSGFSFQD